MNKFLLSLMACALLVGGCTQQQHAKAPQIFQMVNEQEATLVQEGKERRYCVRCGMDLVRFYKTSHAAQEGDKQHQYCSIHCLEEHLGQGITLKNPKVVDVASLKFIPVGEAHYVVGSKIRGTMSRVSKYAFAKLEDAKKFQEENGGEIMDFAAARKKAQEDFKHYAH